MNCQERKKFEQLENELERTKRIYRRRIERMINDRPRQQLERVLDSVCVLLIGSGIALALRGIMIFYTWLNVGW